MENLVIGLGEVGSAIAKILECDGIDRHHEAPQKSYKFMHVCFPYSEDFETQVLEYTNKYSPDHVVIHSTVPMGTSKMLGATHSPVRGIHPHLEQGIRTFVKYFGGDDAYVCAKVFKEKGLNTECFLSSETTEALKLWDTTIYGINILIEKEIYAYCKRNGLDFNAIYTHANATYNDGYEKLGHPEFKKYILKHVDGVIGGHCILPNAKLLDSYIAKLLL